eukprot:GHVT01014083.1.p1 GENE.GHVT01014083.1~~GHVT01014083.1.p1  ORF type:complete len:168 (-),score=26.23 GHVT01014083.1:223-726(-)
MMSLGLLPSLRPSSASSDGTSPSPQETILRAAARDHLSGISREEEYRLLCFLGVSSRPSIGAMAAAVSVGASAAPNIGPASFSPLPLRHVAGQLLAEPPIFESRKPQHSKRQEGDVGGCRGWGISAMRGKTPGGGSSTHSSRFFRRVFSSATSQRHTESQPATFDPP